MMKRNLPDVLLLTLVLFVLLPPPAVLAGDKDKTKDRDLPNFAQVGERLYRGGQPTDAGLKKLVACSINTIISPRQSDSQGAREKAAAEALGLRWFNVPMENLWRPKDEEISQVLALINDPANGKVFVHCKRGADRTGAVIAIYRMTQEGWTAEKAIREAKSYKMRWWQFSKRDYIRDYEKKQEAGTSK